ncbi:Hypothetical inner membrane leucine rich repeat protein [Ectocarpus siliculosus]|uniref:Hypothetical inner membrane leucine rich repeat protein n=1 Tax=Ectocarpus siliculosus TaxID=2880 RepID=D7G1X2_ECTSI|nr:Hypothetical inner membrane leucine rich repeat protein [Ectocarpus siliculosus]|eukprot:CBJ48698.1 Hypothetical inner membrane leucine rich repeat protein [Ectocarpus siliculosus]
MVTTRAKGDAEAINDEVTALVHNGGGGGENGNGGSKECRSSSSSGADPLDDNEAVKTYIRNCRAYDVPVDPSVVISLKTEWDVLQPTRGFGAGSMLPLAGVLDTNKHVKKLRLRGTGSTQRRPVAGGGNSNARILGRILAQNDTIEHLDLSNTGLDADGMRELCAALEKNSSLTDLNLSRNRFGAEGASVLEGTLDSAPALRALDVRSNALGYKSIAKIQRRCCCRPSGCRELAVEVDGNFVFEEVLNAGTHGVGFVAAIIGAFLLMTEASQEGKSPEHFWGCAIFSASLMFLYLASTLYHSFFMLPYVSGLLCIADHCAIYILIAGSYTPFMLISMHGSSLGRTVIIAQWLCALFGCLFSMTSYSLDFKGTMYVELTLYLGLGLSVLLVWDSVLEHMHQGELMLIAGYGGAACCWVCVCLV